MQCSYVEPLVEHVAQLLSHRKLEEGDAAHVNATLRQQLATQGSGSGGVYCVAIDAQRPGTGYIAFGAGGPTSSVYKEWFNITPKGEGC
jgi:hypothetical protein